MIGKRIRVNDYKLTYGKEVVYVNVYGAFKDKKSSNKYIVYSYDNVNKINFGSAFIRDKEIVIMASKEDNVNTVKKFINSILDKEENKNFDIIDLDNIETVQIIDEEICDMNISLDKLKDLTIPKPPVVVEEEKPKKKVPLYVLFILILFAVVVVFFLINPQVLLGENKSYTCTKTYLHDTLPASVNEEINLTFTSKGEVLSIDTTSDYVFTDIDYYKEFRDKSYFYQYFSEGDTYKFDDSTYTYRLFSKIDIDNDTFLPKEEESLINYYNTNGYECKTVEVE